MNSDNTGDGQGHPTKPDEVPPQNDNQNDKPPRRKKLRHKTAAERLRSRARALREKDPRIVAHRRALGRDRNPDVYLQENFRMTAADREEASPSYLEFLHDWQDRLGLHRADEYIMTTHWPDPIAPRNPGAARAPRPDPWEHDQKHRPNVHDRAPAYDAEIRAENDEWAITSGKPLPVLGFRDAGCYNRWPYAIKQLGCEWRRTAGRRAPISKYNPQSPTDPSQFSRAMQHGRIPAAAQFQQGRNAGRSRQDLRYEPLSPDDAAEPQSDYCVFCDRCHPHGREFHTFQRCEWCSKGREPPVWHGRDMHLWRWSVRAQRWVQIREPHLGSYPPGYSNAMYMTREELQDENRLEHPPPRKEWYTDSGDEEAWNYDKKGNRREWPTGPLDMPARLASRNHETFRSVGPERPLKGRIVRPIFNRRGLPVNESSDEEVGISKLFAEAFDRHEDYRRDLQQYPAMPTPDIGFTMKRFSDNDPGRWSELSYMVDTKNLSRTWVEVMDRFDEHGCHVRVVTWEPDTDASSDMVETDASSDETQDERSRSSHRGGTGSGPEAARASSRGAPRTYE